MKIQTYFEGKKTERTLILPQKFKLILKAKTGKNIDFGAKI